VAGAGNDQCDAVIVIADLDTLLIALYVELTDRIIPSQALGRSRAGQAAATAARSRPGCGPGLIFLSPDFPN
jgi:hypothetical protein